MCPLYACVWCVPYLLALEEVCWDGILYCCTHKDCKDRQFTVIIEGGVLGCILFAAGIESLCKD